MFKTRVEEQEAVLRSWCLLVVIYSGLTEGLNLYKYLVTLLVWWTLDVQPSKSMCCLTSVDGSLVGCSRVRMDLGLIAKYKKEKFFDGLLFVENVGIT